MFLGLGFYTLMFLVYWIIFNNIEYFSENSNNRIISRILSTNILNLLNNIELNIILNMWNFNILNNPFIINACPFLKKFLNKPFENQNFLIHL